MKNRSQTWGFYSPVIIIFLALALRNFSWSSYWRFVREDGICENLQFLLLVGAGWLSFVKSRSFADQYWALSRVMFLASVLFLFVALEEISWGQRIFGFSAPDFIASNNDQGEFTLHNIHGLKSVRHCLYILIGLLGTVKFFFSKQMLNSFLSRNGFSVLFPNQSLCWYFLPVALYYLYLEFLNDYILLWSGNTYLLWQDQELFELLLAAGVFLHLYHFRSPIEESCVEWDRSPKFARNFVLWPELLLICFSLYLVPISFPKISGPASAVLPNWWWCNWDVFKSPSHIFRHDKNASVLLTSRYVGPNHLNVYLQNLSLSHRS